ncbi:MAG: CarD family transcriptional regulator [Firmicutes bacterium]|nr:CarD family transcriptional regulator [Bacillota bacterium]MCL5038669.1 CarD family transcriptional regulator [Bacillota bacterium]
MFSVGDKVVYPMHGAGVIESIEEREVLGARQKYYVMRLPVGEMKVMIPIEQVHSTGLRQVITKEEVGQVLTVLRESDAKLPGNWNHRYRANLEKMKSGNIYEVAEVVRSLALRDREKGLSSGEKKMLDNARQILISEIALATNDEERRVHDLLNQALLG